MCEYMGECTESLLMRVLTDLRLLVCLLVACLFGRMEAVFAWCKGAKFIEVQRLTNSFEGSTIRTLRRLEELVRQIAAASKAIGNYELERKFEEGSEKIKRDIVFCSSLYL
jgi:ATP-dependent RNA helicase DOB1